MDGGGCPQLFTSRRMKAASFRTGYVTTDVTGPVSAPSSSADSYVEVAKVIRKFTAENKKPVIKGGFLEGKQISGAEVADLAKLPAKEVLQAMLLGTLQAPCTQLAGVLHQKVASLVYVLDAVKTKKEQEA